METAMSSSEFVRTVPYPGLGNLVTLVAPPGYKEIGHVWTHYAEILVSSNSPDSYHIKFSSFGSVYIFTYQPFALGNIGLAMDYICKHVRDQITTVTLDEFNANTFTRH